MFGTLGLRQNKTSCSKQTKSALLKLVHEEEQEEEEEKQEKEQEEMGAGGNAAGGGAGRADSNQPAVSRFVKKQRKAQWRKAKKSCIEIFRNTEIPVQYRYIYSNTLSFRNVMLRY